MVVSVNTFMVNDIFNRRFLNNLDYCKSVLSKEVKKFAVFFFVISKEGLLIKQKSHLLYKEIFLQ